MAKYGNVKQGAYDSQIEKKIYANLRLLQSANRIVALKRLDNNKDFTILMNAFETTKNGKKAKLRAIKYTPDFYFYNVKTNIFPYLPDGIHVWLESKQPITSKVPDYGMRKKMFIKMLPLGHAFVEVIVSSKGHGKTTVYLGRARQTDLFNTKIIHKLK